MALQRVTIGFQGSPQVLGVRLEPAALEGLLAALTSGGWHDLAVDDGTILLHLDHVVYVRTEHDEQRVGFGISS